MISLLFLGLLITCPAARGADGPMPPANLKCEYLSNPLGMDVLQPRFAWTLNHTQRGEKQTAYQVLVANSLAALDKDKADQWDSGRLESDNSIQVVYDGKPLLSGSTYYWKVRYWDRENRSSPYSAPAQFEMGLLSRNEWQGHWISGNMLRKKFQLAGKVSRARLYVTALGYYELHLNGVRVGENVLDPAWTDFRKRILYSTYDVTSMLHRGENAIGGLLGGGWATLGTGMLGGKPYYNQPALMLQLNIEFEDGKRASVESDGSWKMTRGPIVSDNVYDGEVYDARRGQTGWDRAGFDDSDWKSAQVVEGSSGILSAEMLPPIRVISSMTPVRMVSPKPGIFVYDMGQNFSGWARLRVSGPAGTEVTLRFGEVVHPDGSLDAENLRQAKQREIYILSGDGEEVYEPHFTYHGFRYVEVSGFPGTPGMDSIEGRVVHTSVKSIGSFATSKPILNDIQRLIGWTQLSNLFSIPTDCDQRDEREGWMGDAQLSAEEAMMNFDMAAFYTNFIRDIRDELGSDGSLPDTVPEKFGQRPADPGWGTAYPLLCWYMWQQYGDRRILEENYQGLQKYVEFLRSRAPDNVLRFNYYGDWIATVETPGELISDAYYYYDIKLLQKIGAVLGKDSDEREYEKLAGQVKDAFNRNFYNVKAGYYGSGTQTANSMALFLGLVPENEIGRVSFYLERDIQNYHNLHLTTGIVGTKYLMPALTATGRSDVAYNLAVQTTYPSWGFMLEHGATTVWELWQDKNRPMMNSHDHPALGSVGAWFYRALGGIDMGESGEGFLHIRIAPQMVEDLRWASASIDTIRGRVSSAWSHSYGDTKLEVTIPVNSDAEIILTKDPQLSEIVLSEGGRPIWQSGASMGNENGIKNVRRDGDRFVINVGSGHYAFELAGK